MKPHVAKSRSGSENRKRKPRVYSRVTEAELAKIETDAEAIGLSVGSYIRFLALDHPETRPVRVPLADVVLLTQLKGQVGRIGGNVHQLLRMARIGEIPWSEELAKAAQEVRDFLMLAAEILKRGAG